MLDFLRNIQEPFSTWTNLAFIVAGIIVGILTPAEILLASTLVILGVGSFAFHALGSITGTPAHRLDEAGIYAVGGALIHMAWLSNPVVLAVTSAILGVMFLRLSDVDSFIATPIIGGIIGLGMLINVGLGSAAVTLAVAGIAVLINIKLQNDVGHGMWHIMITTAIMMAWSYITAV